MDKLLDLSASLYSSRHNPNIPKYKVLVNRRSKGIKLYVGRNGITIVSKTRLHKHFSDSLILDNIEWINEQLKEVVRPSSNEVIDSIEWMGERMEVRWFIDTITSCKFVGKNIVVKAKDKKTFKEVLGKKLKKEARSQIVDRVRLIADTHGFEFGDVRVRDTSSRWGSCSSRKNLNFSWRLALAPTQIMEYVIVHELAHTLEANHSKRFWDIVSSIDSEYKLHRKWLKEHGKELFNV